MKKTEKKLGVLLGVGALAMVAVAGCQDTNKNGQPDTPASGAQIENAAGTAGNAVSNAASDAGNAASNAVNAASNAASTTGKVVVNAAHAAGNAASNAASAVGNAASNAANSVAKTAKNADDAITVTPRVKAALGANAALKGSNINVDTTDKDVTLSGSVTSMTQKTVAEQIAKKQAAGYMIKNNLKVGGAMAPSKGY